MSERTPTTDLSRGALLERRWRDLAILAPVLGILLLVSPIVTIFNVGGRVFGVPVVFVFLYGVWLGLIVLARRIAARLDADDVDS